MNYLENLITYSGPNGEKATDDFLVNVNGETVFVYKARVSAVPLDTIWPGYQRPLDQTELAAFAYWDMSVPVVVEVISTKLVKTVAIRPSSYGIKPKVKGNTITFTLPIPKHITVEVNGINKALHLFANPIEETPVSKNDPKVRYFGPGIHNAGKIILNEGDTVYIDGGAVVHGVIEAKRADNIKILGRGILDTSSFGRVEAEGSISLYRCNNVEINGIIIRDPNIWTVIPAACHNVNIFNIKLIGLWRYNADGIDIVNCQHVKIERCFIRAFDDCIVIKGLKSWPWDKTENITKDMNVQDVFVNDCVLWNDWGRALEIGAETIADEMSNITFKNCDIIHFTHIALDIQHSDHAFVKDIRYENIHIEIDDHPHKPVFQFFENEEYVIRKDDNYCPQLFFCGIGQMWWSQDKERGHVKNVYLKDIFVTGKHMPKSIIHGFDDSHIVDNVTFENMQINGKSIKNKEEGSFIIGEFAKDIVFK